MTSSADVAAAATMDIEAVMENLQRVQQRQRINEQKSDEVMEGDMRGSGDDLSDRAERQRSYSPSSQKADDDSADDERTELGSPGMMKNNDDARSTEADKSSSLIAQQVALAAALANRGGHQNGGSIPPALSALMPHSMLQQFGQFQANVEPSQLPQASIN